MNLVDVSEDIGVSIANEERALSDLLEAEKKKIQKFVDEGASADELLQVNNSVNEVVEVANKLDGILKEKLSLIARYLKI